MRVSRGIHYSYIFGLVSPQVFSTSFALIIEKLEVRHWDFELSPDVG